MTARPLVLPALTPDVGWSVCLRDARTSAVLAEQDPDRVQRTASVGKLFLLLEVARRLEDGLLDVDEPLGWEEGEWVADSGLWHLMGSRQLPLGDLCWLVGGFSDNLATNVLLRRVGVDAVTATTHALGFTRSALLDRVRLDRGPDHPPTLSRGTAGELSDLIARLHRGELVSPAVSGRVRAWIAANADLSMTAAAFGLDPLAHAESDRGLTMINKTGTISTARIDVGVVAGPAAEVAWAVLAEWDTGSDPRDEVLSTMRRVGDAVRAHVEDGT
ncbi:serine hydrolase [Auraticoccus monumenti]|uniref:Beta-lactamase class A n=1 Tax=Auraticoccus monumenti TaxID=675864 RepID=A0A1G6W2X6_9ACTN|nr:serine hydrolase [Auraticoccus monumenti]SDD59396.1 beta-lactamase class A [Auraticoccus monumenti]